MYVSRKRPIIFIGLLLCFITVNGQYTKKYKARPYKAKIMDRPSEVDVVKCGDDIRLTCIAEGEPTPDIEWWFKNQDQDEGRHGLLMKAAREGRVKIKTEKLFVVRSTLIIHDADETDEGLYQCRASNSPKRKHKNINLLQHWKIEEVPVGKVMCGDISLTQTEVYPASNFNESVVSESTERALSSLGLTSSTTKPAPVKTSQMTSSTTVLTVKPNKHRKPGEPSLNSVSKEKKEPKKKFTKTIIERETIDIEEGHENEMSDGVRGSEIVVEENDDGNSALGMKQSSWMMVLLHLPIAGVVLLTSSC